MGFPGARCLMTDRFKPQIVIESIVDSKEMTATFSHKIQSPPDFLGSSISTTVFDAKEKACRKALIKLGWTPPRKIGYFRRIWEVIKWGKNA